MKTRFRQEKKERKQDLDQKKEKENTILTKKKERKHDLNQEKTKTKNKTLTKKEKEKR